MLVQHDKRAMKVMQHATATVHGVQQDDLTRAVSGMERVVDSSAKSLERQADGLRAKADREARVAGEERRVKKILSRAQSELNAYAVNLEGMMTAGGDVGSRLSSAELSQFPKEAANLHALLDMSLGKADTLAVQMAKGDEAREHKNQAKGVVAEKAHKKHQAHQSFMEFSHIMPHMAADPLQPAFPPKVGTFPLPASVSLRVLSSVLPCYVARQRSSILCCLLQDVFENLCSSALTFSHRGGCRDHQQSRSKKPARTLSSPRSEPS